MYMAVKLRDLVDKTSGVNLQIDGHMDVPTQSVKDPLEPEEEDSSPSHLPTWSLAWRPPTSCPNSEILFGDTSNFNRRIGGHTPHPLIPEWPPW